MSQKIITVIIILLIAGALLYVVKSGVIGNSIHALETSFPKNLPNTGGSSGANNQSYISSNTNENNSNNGNGNTGGGISTSTINPADIPAGFTASQLSPYFQEIRIGGASYGGYGYYGQISLDAYNIPASDTIDITGWELKSKDSGEYVPQAINLYDPSGLTAPTDIDLHQNDVVYLYSSKGAFNLRLNECIGYIAQNNIFTPQLPDNCPYEQDPQISNFTGACQNYIESINGSCQTPNLNSPNVPINDYACRDYLENSFNYESCFDAHKSDADFLSNQIWVWMGGNILDQYHDQLELLDRNGLVVDVYTY